MRETNNNQVVELIILKTDGIMTRVQFKRYYLVIIVFLLLIPNKLFADWTILPGCYLYVKDILLDFPGH